MKTLDQAMSDLLDAAANDYAAYCERTEYSKETDFEEFRSSLSVEEGRKYLKVIKDDGCQRSVWGFVVKADDHKFIAGDILKPAGWKTPARNAARGNVFGEYSVRWTGPNYLN